MKHLFVTPLIIHLKFLGHYLLRWKYKRSCYAFM